MRRDAMQCNKIQNHDVETDTRSNAAAECQEIRKSAPVPCIVWPKEPNQGSLVMLRLFRYLCYAIVIRNLEEKLKATAREMM
jgi:hypothetical protein